MSNVSKRNLRLVQQTSAEDVRRLDTVGGDSSRRLDCSDEDRRLETPPTKRCLALASTLVLVLFLSGCHCCGGGNCCPSFCASNPSQTEQSVAAYPPQTASNDIAYEASAPIIRAQYTMEPGRSMPSLPPATRTIAPASQGYSSYPAPAAQASPYGAMAPVASPPAAYPSDAASAPSTPGYGNQYPGGDYPRGTAAEPEGLYPPGTLGDPNVSPLAGNPPWDEPPRYLDINPYAQETQTGRLMFGVGVNSDAGLVGSVVVDEQNFDWRRFPRSWEEIRNATAWRGRGQRFRLEAMPGTVYQRYMAEFQDPYFLNSQWSLGLSGFYYTRRFLEWDEDRVGGRVALGYMLSPDLSVSFAYRGERVSLFNPAVPTPPEIAAAEGTSALHGFKVSLAHDTRDNQFLATEGHLLQLGFEQVVGTYSYPRADVELRRYFLLHERPDGSGRHVLQLGGSMCVSGSDTPVYEHYFAGGFSTIRGFDFRGASPTQDGVFVGGEFMVLASVEYLFPITADDAIRGVVFCDTGTVEPTISDWSDRYRVAPGVGLRIVVPAMGPAPIALDFAFPISRNPDDREEVFSFFVGFNH